MNKHPAYINSNKKIIYFDMDNVLVNFSSAFEHLSENVLKEYENRLDEVPGIFDLMQPVKGAIQAFKKLSKDYDVYILSTAPWDNPSAWESKIRWVKMHLPQEAYKRLILSHNKHLNKGDYLIDDRTANGADKFEGELIQFGSDLYPDWESVLEYFENV